MLTNIVLISAKYFILFFFILFVFASYRAQRDVPEEKKRSNYRSQRAFMLLIHAVSFLCIIIHAANDDLSFKVTEAVLLYAGQLVYLLIISIVIPAVVSLNKGLNNVMCMFLTISFIIQARLNFHASVRQFYLVMFATVLFLLFIFFCKRIRILHKLTWLYCMIGLALLAAVLVLAAVTKGAKLSIDFGSFSFQPMEFVKIIFVLFVAAAFNKANTFKTVLITTFFAALHIIILVFCRDLGSALILFAIYVLMVYIATKKARYIVAGVLSFSAASVIAYYLFSHVKVRVNTWRDPWADIEGGGYQITQALFAIGTGGWFGAGLFMGAPGYVPEVANDMVFSAIAEELGGVFAILLIFLCLCFALMILRVAIRLEYVFYKLLAFGLAVAYIFQVFLNIGGSIKFIPLTGVNLPFISLGGSSILSSMIIIGIVQALYVLSEADVKKEKQALKDGVDIRGFYEEEELTKEDEYDENTSFIRIDDRYREDREDERRRKKRKDKNRRTRREERYDVYDDEPVYDDIDNDHDDNYDELYEDEIYDDDGRVPYGRIIAGQSYEDEGEYDREISEKVRRIQIENVLDEEEEDSVFYNLKPPKKRIVRIYQEDIDTDGRRKRR